MTSKQQNECDTGKVVDIKGDFATIELDSAEACQSCSIKSFCNMGSDDKLQLKMLNTKNAKLHDTVQFEIESALKILSNFYVFILPLLVIVITYFFTKSIIKLSEDISILISVFSLFISYFILKHINRIFKKNRTIKIKMIKIINQV